MPHTESAKKRLRQNAKRRLNNRVAKKVIKTYSKKALAQALEGNLEQAEKDLRFALSRIDKAGVRRVLHPNTADRRKSRLTREYQAAVAKAKGSTGHANPPAG
jgi:small subunit ribosomal protein S20